MGEVIKLDTSTNSLTFTPKKKPAEVVTLPVVRVRGSDVPPGLNEEAEQMLREHLEDRATYPVPATDDLARNLRLIDSMAGINDMPKRD